MKNSIAQTIGRWDTIPADNKPFFRLGLENSIIALYLLILRNPEEARPFFKKASENYSECIRNERTRFGMTEEEMTVCRALLHTAILSGEKSEIETAVRTCLATDENFPRKHRGFATFYYYDVTLGNILIGRKEEALAVIDKINYRPGKLKNLLNGDRFSLEGIIRNNRSMFLEGLHTGLSFHAHHVGKDPGPADEMVCVPALVHIRLAHMNGMDIRKDEINERYHRFIPWCLFSTDN